MPFGRYHWLGNNAGLLALSVWDLAVDVGVTAVVAAVRDEAGIELVTFDGRSVLPALVRCSHGPPQAGVWLADDRVTATPGTILLSPKRLMVSPALASESDFPAAAAELYAAILQTVAETAAEGREEAVPGRLILTHPANWTEDHLDVLRDAAAAAELPDPEFLAEPFAAAWCLARGNVPGQIVAVLDVGDGSVDTALLRRTAAGFELIGSPGTVTRTGDDPLDVSARRGIYDLLATIRSAGLTADDLAEVYVTGGASREFQVENLIGQFLGITARLDRSPLTASAWGALISATAPGEAQDFAAAEEFTERRPGRVAAVRTALVVAAITLIAAAGAIIVHQNLAGHQTAGGPVTKQRVTTADPPSRTAGSRSPAPRHTARASRRPKAIRTSHAPSPSPTATSTPVTSPTPVADPAAVVEDYVGAINDHDYQAAWQLGGYHFASSYSAFTAGFATTVRDELDITGVNGDDVSVQITAVQTNGTNVVFEGTYVISGGVIASASMREAG